MPDSVIHPIIPADNVLDATSVTALVRRLELQPTLLKRLEEEEITRLVDLPRECFEDRLAAMLDGVSRDDFLQSRGWTEEDLWLNVCRPEALRRFAEQHFGPGLEEQFLSSRGAHDKIIYSMLRVRNSALARELWIRIEENETTFAEAAQRFGEGPEASRNGLVGPMAIGKLAPPQLVKLLRRLQPGQVSPPHSMGDWTVLLRLEQLTPAKFDAKMRGLMLTSSLDELLDERVSMRLNGQFPDPLNYHTDS